MSTYTKGSTTLYKQFVAKVFQWWTGGKLSTEKIPTLTEKVSVEPYFIEGGVAIPAAKSTTGISSPKITLRHTISEASSVLTLRTINSYASDSLCSSCSQRCTCRSGSASPRVLLDGLSELENEPFVQMEEIPDDMFISEISILKNPDNSTIYSNLVAKMSNWWTGRESNAEDTHFSNENVSVEPCVVRGGVAISAAKPTTSLSSPKITDYRALSKTSSVTTLRAISCYASNSFYSCSCSQRGTFGSGSLSPRFLIDGLFEFANENIVQIEDITDDLIV